jgi:AsmA-like protein
VSNTLTDVALQAEPLEPPRARSVPWKRWLKRLLFLVLLLWVADYAFSLLIQHSRLRTVLTHRLESVFGRPVEVGSYSFSLWHGPALEARSLEVGEDVRFGREYFLRAESLTVRLRWQSLFAGRLELGTLSLSHPSLNLVRNPDGDWNLAEWLPRPTLQGGQTAAAPRASALAGKSWLRLERIEVDSGRINFKRGDDKLPFALASVNGYLEPDGPGRWQMDLEAIPSRAAVIVQQAGLLHLAGHLGGMSSRLRPAALDFSWQGASISDVLRLTRNSDYGVRGTLALAINAQTVGDNWTLDGRAEMRQLHRWDLALRTDNPAVNLIAKAKLDLGGSRLDVLEARLDAPHSNAHAVGSVDWSRWGSPEFTDTFGERAGDKAGDQTGAPVGIQPGAQLQFTSSEIALDDALAWIRAFRSGVATDISLQGSAKGAASFSGWPPQLSDGVLEVSGAELNGPRLRVPVRLNGTEIRYDSRGIHFSPASIIFGGPGAPQGVVAIDSPVAPARKGYSNLRIAGHLAQVRDILGGASAFGWNISRGWDVAGPVGFEFVWMGARYPWQAQVKGNVVWGDDARGISLHAPFLNLPVEEIRARADITSSSRHIVLTSAKGFGARWTGTFDRRVPDGEWQFALAADRLAVADVDRWLNPHWRESFLDRMLPFLTSPATVNAAPEGLRAAGRLNLEQFVLEPFMVRRLAGDVKIAGRNIDFANAEGEFYGGKIGATLKAELGAARSYHVALDFSHVDLAAMSAVTTNYSNLFAGDASGAVSFDAKGTNRDDLVNSLVCQGTAHVSSAELRSINLEDSLRDAARRPGTSSFREVSTGFACGERQIRFQNVVLIGSSERMEGSGSVDFSQNLDFRFRQLSDESGPRAPGASGASLTSLTAGKPAKLSKPGKLDSPQKTNDASIQLTGVLSAPVIARKANAAGPR